MSSKEASPPAKRIGCTSALFSADSLALCGGYIVLLACILAFTDRWCPLPVAAEEITIMVIVLLLPLACNLGFRRRQRKCGAAFEEDMSQARTAMIEKAFTEDESLTMRHQIATASFDGTLRIWSSNGECEQRLDGHLGAALYSVSVSSDGKHVATGDCDGTAIVWASETGVCLHKFNDCGGIVSSMAFSPCSTKLITGTDDHCLQLWALNDSKDTPEIIFEGHYGAVSSVAFSPCGAFVASGSHDATARLWSVDSGACERVLEGHDAEVLAIAYAPYCNMVATGSQDGTMRLWSAGAGWCILVFEGHEAAIRSVAFSSCGSLLCTGSADGTAKLWDAQTGTCKITLRSNDSGSIVNCVALSANGSTIATTQDNVSRIWDAETGACLSLLEGHTDIVQSVAISN